jgi:hypothetical protein
VFKITRTNGGNQGILKQRIKTARQQTFQMSKECTYNFIPASKQAHPHVEDRLVNLVQLQPTELQTPSQGQFFEVQGRLNFVGHDTKNTALIYYREVY